MIEYNAVRKTKQRIFMTWINARDITLSNEKTTELDI